MNLLDWGINLILALQQNASAPLYAAMRFFSFLGQEEFFLLVAPAVYWCVDAALGLRLGLFLMVSASLNSTVKLLFHAPRPYWIDSRVLALVEESSFGVPSGHAQNAVTFWGALAFGLRKRWAWAAAIGLMSFIGLSRLYLGVHFPTDVLMGWLIGASLLWLLRGLEKPSLWMIRSLHWLAQIGYPFAAALALIALRIFAGMFLAGWQLPPAWALNAAAAFPEAEPLNPLAIAGVVSNSAVFFGLAAGAILLARNGGFDARGPLLQRIARYLIGLLGIVALWYGLGALFPRGEELLPLTLRFIRYALVGAWVSWLAPLIFRRLNLASALN
ncbi:MAG: phosphatase PAP2 family protein [Chloroflexi bacterium]|nr:phosphatase PAP2 family protein [Chloroflexota bacterium]